MLKSRSWSGEEKVEVRRAERLKRVGVEVEVRRVGGESERVEVRIVGV